MYNRENLPEANVWSPKYLPAHLSLLLLRAIVALPDPCIRAAGSALGFIAFHLLKKRVFITRRNLEICYPELSSEEREKLVREALPFGRHGHTRDRHGLVLVKGEVQEAYRHR